MSCVFGDDVVCTPIGCNPGCFCTSDAVGIRMSGVFGDDVICTPIGCNPGCFCTSDAVGIRMSCAFGDDGMVGCIGYGRHYGRRDSICVCRPFGCKSVFWDSNIPRVFGCIPWELCTRPAVWCRCSMNGCLVGSNQVVGFWILFGVCCTTGTGNLCTRSGAQLCFTCTFRPEFHVIQLLNTWKAKRMINAVNFMLENPVVFRVSMWPNFIPFLQQNSTKLC